MLLSYKNSHNERGVKIVLGILLDVKNEKYEVIQHKRQIDIEKNLLMTHKIPENIGFLILTNSLITGINSPKESAE